MMIAARRGHSEVVGQLLAAGAQKAGFGLVKAGMFDRLTVPFPRLHESGIGWACRFYACSQKLSCNYLSIAG